MKKLYLLLTVILLSSSIHAQAPELMSYQAIVRGADDALIQNGNIGIRISILQGSETGTAVYTETHTVTTNENGLVTLDIGSGSTADDFSTIDWSTGTYFIKSETDPNGGTNYSIEGTSQLLSVPYALYAKSTEQISEGENGLSNVHIPSTNVISSSNFAVFDFYDNVVYAYNGQTGIWSSQAVNEALPTTAMSTSNGNFAVFDFYDNVVYTFNGVADTWASQTVNEALPATALSLADGNFAVFDFYDNVVYGYNGQTGTWSSQAVSEALPSSALTTSNGNFAVFDFYDNVVYVFNGRTGLWSSQPISEALPSTALSASNGNFVVFDFYDNVVHAYTGQTGTWSSINVNEALPTTSLFISEN